MMRVEFIDKGVTASIVITSYFWQRQKRFRLLNIALLEVPNAAWSMKAGFTVKTIISGPIITMLRAHKMIWREVNK
jgi:hypothetical protein